MINVKQKHVKFQHNHIRWIDIQDVIFFHAAIVSFFEGQNATLLKVTLLTMSFLAFFQNEKSEYKILSAKMFVIRLVIE